VRAEGASACPSVETVRDGVMKRLGWNPFADDAPKSFEVVAKRAGNVWQASIYSYDQRGTSGFREIRSETDDCGELASAVALAIALAIDPDAALASAPAAVPAQPPRTIPLPDRAPPVSSACPSPRWNAAIAARGVGAIGVLPRAAAGAAIGALAYGPARLAFSTGALLLPSVRTEPDAPVFGFGLTAGWFDACFAVRGASTAARACGGLRAGVIHAVVYTPTPTEPGDRFWWAAGASVAGERIVTGPLFVEAGVEVMVPFVRYRFLSENFGAAVFEQPPVAGVGFVGVGFRID
jgi:hypothetical protein